MPVTLPPDPLEKIPATLSPDLPEDGRLSPDLLWKMDAYWRAANYLSVGQIYLKDNPPLESPLRLEQRRWRSSLSVPHNYSVCTAISRL